MNTLIRRAQVRASCWIPVMLLLVLAAACGSDEPADVAGPDATAAETAAPPQTPPAAAPAVDLLADIGFTSDSVSLWHSSDEATEFLPPMDLDPERARIAEKAQIYWQFPVPGTREGDPFRLTVRARKVGVEPLRLRLQVTWLPEGGWSAKGKPGGEHLRSDIEVFDVDSFGWQSYVFDVTQAPQALDVVVYLVNAGPHDVEVADITFENLALDAGSH